MGALRSSLRWPSAQPRAAPAEPGASLPARSAAPRRERNRERHLTEVLRRRRLRPPRFSGMLVCPRAETGRFLKDLIQGDPGVALAALRRKCDARTRQPSPPAHSLHRILSRRIPQMG